MKLYDTDKCAKDGTSGLLTYYKHWFAPLIGTPAHILELGAAKGGSLRAWIDWFPGGEIVGLDTRTFPPIPGSTIYRGNQKDGALLAIISMTHGPWDIIIDDCCHRADHAQISYDVLWKYLKPGGLYCIEDWGTGYWEGGGYDGKQFEPHHQAGMVGMVKDLIDEVGAAWWTSIPALGPKRFSQIRQMVIHSSVAIVFKR